MNQEAERFRKATMSLFFLQLNSITIMDLFAYGGAAMGIVVVLGLYGAGVMAFGAAFSIVFLSAEFFLPMCLLGSFFHAAMNGMAAAEKMLAILEVPEPRGGVRVVDRQRVDVEYRGVRYSYDGERTVFSGIDFAVPAHGLVGIVGESGSGKTTLAGVLSGRIEGYEGRVEVCGADARELSFASLVETVTTVPTQSYLFKGTVLENLLLADSHAADAQLWDVLAACRLDAFVREAGDLDTDVAEQGSNLSGGQRQRLAVARALLHDASVYVFDEAISNVDAESERVILDVVADLATRASVIVISHRLAIVRAVDRIYALEAGRLAESGTHDELVVAQGVHAQLWSKRAELEAYSSSLAAFDASEAPLAAENIG
ncbi:MAG: ATP-binding cassette domain-containing protein [Gordonibacter sp.]|uniref:ABC transporter ATP-binding protein/permease n=1 Tax=Gordonibacter sp. TaxID=1968902 RepID=UPI002FC609BD